jgi:hypothetical protein
MAQEQLPLDLGFFAFVYNVRKQGTEKPSVIDHGVSSVWTIPLPTLFC